MLLTLLIRAGGAQGAPNKREWPSRRAHLTRRWRQVLADTATHDEDFDPGSAPRAPPGEVHLVF